MKQLLLLLLFIPFISLSQIEGKQHDQLILRVRSFRDGYLPSKVITNSYFNDNLFRGLPIVSLISDSNNFFGVDSGLLVPEKRLQMVFLFLAQIGGLIVLIVI